MHRICVLTLLLPSAAGRQRAEQAAAQDLEDFELDSGMEDADADAADSEEASEDPADGFGADGGRQEGGSEASPAEDEGGGNGGRTAAGAVSAHERRMARMAERTRRLEEENLGEKEWFMRGEAGAREIPPHACLPPSEGTPKLLLGCEPYPVSSDHICSRVS